jgi:hypothetical protein
LFLLVRPQELLCLGTYVFCHAFVFLAVICNMRLDYIRASSWLSKRKQWIGKPALFGVRLYLAMSNRVQKKWLFQMLFKSSQLDQHRWCLLVTEIPMQARYAPSTSGIICVCICPFLSIPLPTLECQQCWVF